MKEKKKNIVVRFINMVEQFQSFHIWNYQLYKNCTLCQSHSNTNVIEPRQCFLLLSLLPLLLYFAPVPKTHQSILSFECGVCKQFCTYWKRGKERERAKKRSISYMRSERWFHGLSESLGKKVKLTKINSFTQHITYSKSIQNQ